MSTVFYFQRKEIKQIIIDNLDTLKKAWHEHFK
jgi:hypothetical protein